MVFEVGVYLSDDLYEVLLDNAYDVETVGYDLGIREVPGDKCAVGAAEIHADDSDLVLAFEVNEVAFQVLGITALHDVKDAVVCEVAESCCKAGGAAIRGFFPMDGVFVDPEDWRADAVEMLSCLGFGILFIEALDGGGAECLLFCQNTPGYTVVVEFVDFFPERF